MTVGSEDVVAGVTGEEHPTRTLRPTARSAKRWRAIALKVGTDFVDCRISGFLEEEQVVAQVSLDRPF